MKDKKLQKFSDKWLCSGDSESAKIIAQEILDPDLRNKQLDRISLYEEQVAEYPLPAYSKKSMMDNMHTQLGNEDNTTTTTPKEDNLLRRRMANFCLGTTTPYSCEQEETSSRHKHRDLHTKNDTVLVMVECVSQFRQRYVIEVDAEYPEYALDNVAMGRCKEFSQVHLGEVVVSHRVVDVDEVLAICDEDNTYCKSWSDEKKLQMFVTESAYDGDEQ